MTELLCKLHNLRSQTIYCGIYGASWTISVQVLPVPECIFSFKVNTPRILSMYIYANGCFRVHMLSILGMCLTICGPFCLYLCNECCIESHKLRIVVNPLLKFTVIRKLVVFRVPLRHCWLATRLLVLFLYH